MPVLFRVVYWEYCLWKVRVGRICVMRDVTLLGIPQAKVTESVVY